MSIDPPEPDTLTEMRAQIAEANKHIAELRKSVAELQQQVAQTNAQTVYQEICTSYHALEDFRAKLLGFLPLASGAGIFFLLNDQLLQKQDILKPFLLPVGLVGAVVTLGLLVYEYRVLQLSHHLVEAGKEIEADKLGGMSGQFTMRAQSLRIHSFRINDILAATIIYPAIFAGWIFLALVLTWPDEAFWIAVAIFVIGLLMYSFWSRRYYSSKGRFPTKLLNET